MIVIDEKRIFDEIQKRKPVSVALNGPDGILPKVQETASKIMERFGIPAYVLADTCFGTCDMNSNGAKVLGAEILFHIGHTINDTTFGENIILIDAFDDISFDKVAMKCATELLGKTVSLVTDSQHLQQIERVKKILEEGGV
ncbi:MAG: diphthamide synthesis protein, partial [Nitrosopumilaceae archaeon]